MALVVEDGTGKSNADSYISVTDADTYFTNHGSPVAWTGAATGAKESALRYATAWLDGHYTWRGEIVLGTQALGWPRYDVEDLEGRLLPSNDVPQRVMDAICELALVHIGDALNAVSAASGRESKRISLDVISIEYTDRESSYVRRVPYTNKLLRGLHTGIDGSVDIVRA